MKSRKKTITKEEFLSKRDGIVSCDIEDVLCGDYVYLLDSMDMEDFEYDDTSFDIFREIVYKNKVVGFASYMREENGLLLMEAYVMPEHRHNNLLCREISNEENLTVYMPKISLVKALIECDMAVELSDGIAVSKIPLNVSSYDLKQPCDGDEYYSHVYDLKNGSVLLLEDPEYPNYSRAKRSDKDKYILGDALSDEHLKKAYEIVCDYDEKYLKVTSKKFKPTIVFRV